MAYFHECAERSRGGRKNVLRIKVIGESVEEQRALKINYPDSVTINWPDRRKGFKTRSQPEVWLNADRQDILEEIGSCEVTKPYITLLTMMLRKQFWEQFGLTYEMKKYFELEIRGKAIDLCKSGLVIENPENPNLQKLHRWIENLPISARKLKTNSVKMESLG